MGLSMLSIMLFHQYFTSFPPFNIFHNFGYWGVDIFLFLSGMGLINSLEKNTTKVFYQRRFYRLIPSCVLCGTLKYILFLVLGSSVAILKDGLNLGIWSLASLDLWFIHTIIIFYAISPMLYRSLCKWTYTTIAFIVLTYFINESTLRPVVGFDWLSPAGVLSWSLERLPVFAFGMFLAIKKDFINDKLPISACFLLLAIALVFFKKTGFLFISLDALIVISLAIGTPALIWLCIALLKKIPVVYHKPLVFLGTYSLEIYLVHEFLFWVLKVYFEKGSPWILLPLSIILSCLSAYCCKHITNKLMKSKIPIILLALLFMSIYVAKKFYAYYSPAKERIAYATVQHIDDTIRIAYIGDSWAFGHSSHSCGITKILEDSLHLPIKLETYGIGGLTSKEIYNALYEVDDLRLFMEKGWDYCFISAGINDTNKKMSSSYYKLSMKCIINFLLSNHIHPIILEIPDYDIIESYNRQNKLQRILRHFSMVINNTSLDCKQDFRDALNKYIHTYSLQKDVMVINYSTWNNNYYNDLKNIYIEDGMHLNEKGYILLDNIIAMTILKDWQE